MPAGVDQEHGFTQTSGHWLGTWFYRDQWTVTRDMAFHTPVGVNQGHGLHKPADVDQGYGFTWTSEH